jgi:hypothetical protein
VLQRRSFRVEEYVSAGCRQFGRPGETLDIIALGLHDFTKGFMCTGCPHSTRGCAALGELDRLDKPQAKSKPTSNETVWQEAARRGISIGEVRRQRNGS